MDPTGKLSPQKWMQDPETLAVFNALKTQGVQARFIGGCVRDAVLGRPVKDIDIATPCPPEQVIALLEDAGIRAIPTGIEHGTITAVTENHHFEITTLRVDVETDGRRAKVAFTDDWTADAARRDLTINAMSCNLDGDIYDPYGGLEDLAQGIIRFVGRARDRIDEDVLRLLRFFRFLAEYGKVPIDPDTLTACQAFAPRLPELSGDRVLGELIRILLAPDPADTFLLMRNNHILKYILPEAGNVGQLRMLHWLTHKGLESGRIAPDPIRSLSALINPALERTAVEALADRLHMSGKQKRHLCQLVFPKYQLSLAQTPLEINKALYHLGADIGQDLVLLAWAEELAINPRQDKALRERWTLLLDAATAWQPRTFPLKGRDVLALGVPPGPQVGELLHTVEAWWQEGDFKANKEACTAYLHDVYKVTPKASPNV